MPIWPDVEYSEYLCVYVMILHGNAWPEDVLGTCLYNSGFYICYSADGISWSEPQQLTREWIYPIMDRSLSWDMTIIWDQGSSNQGWLVYGYSQRWGHAHNPGEVPHYMVGRRITIE